MRKQREHAKSILKLARKIALYYLMMLRSMLLFWFDVDIAKHGPTILSFFVVVVVQTSIKKNNESIGSREKAFSRTAFLISPFDREFAFIFALPEHRPS